MANPFRLYSLVLCLLLSVLAACPVSAMPQIKSTHPRLYLDGTDIARVKAQPFFSEALPAAGRLVAEFRPGRRPNDDPDEIPIIGPDVATENILLVKHLGQQDTATHASILVALRRVNEQSYLIFKVYPVAYGELITVDLEWGNNAANLKVNGVPLGGTMSWSPSPAPLQVLGRRGDLMDSFRLGADKMNPSVRPLNFARQQAWYSLLREADAAVAVNNSCAVDAQPTGICTGIATGSRFEITDPARNLALAYLLTDQPVYLEAAKKMARRLAKLADHPQGFNVGDEWSMAPRIAAMGLLFDYLHGSLLGNTPEGPTYTSILANAIRETSRGPALVRAVCGLNNPLNGSTFACQTTPDYTYPYNGPNTADYYVSGHSQSAVFGMALGLLAIATEHTAVLDMLETIHRHFTDGFLPARDLISDKGGHIGFAYGSQGGELGERLLMWNRVFDQPAAEDLFAPAWLATLIDPYIYGLRSDARFPASGDTFNTAVQHTAIDLLAQNGMAAGNGYARSFYEEQVLPVQPTFFSQALWRELLYPAPTVTAIPLETRPLAEDFGYTGQVLMRDSWDFRNATVLEFKSSRFISENHHHLDQNSFSIFFRTPLLIDSGAYEKYGSVHWRNYYTRSIAHNTMLVFDEAENFGTASNDGGQWFGTRSRTPFIADLAPGGSHALAGLQAFENQTAFAYARGDASKAYSDAKLEQQGGFVRQIAMLRSGIGQPTIVTFDVVKTKAQKTATAVLHFRNHVVTQVAQTGLGVGRIRLDFQANERRIFTTRASDAMLTTQVLLPADARIVQAGGQYGAAVCQQALQDGTVGAAGGDCRFTAKMKIGAAWQWVNQPLITPPEQPLPPDDIGSYRVEIEAPSVPPTGEQVFLAVFHPAIRAGNDADVATVPEAQVRPSLQGSTAVAVDNRVTVLFNHGSTPATGYQWTPPPGIPAFLATGMAANADYALSVSGGTYTLAATPGGSLRSSPNGVVASGF